MRLTADLIESFAGMYLSPHYDTPFRTPEFHRTTWQRYCSDDRYAATAAPRGHAKSTAFTHDYVMAAVLFREVEYVILVSATEEMAKEHLADMAREFVENEDLLRDFKIKEFVTEQKTDIVVKCLDGHQFRIMARGAEQKIRGLKWRGKRPGLIVCDDLEDDEQVESRERRKKFSRWFYRACVQSLRGEGKIRCHGTILHDDSLLAGLMKHPSWNARLYRAHASFDDFSQILWPEKFPESELRSIRDVFIRKQDSAGYSQEFLNDPLDYADAYLRKEDFLPMSEEDFEFDKVIAVGVDWAVSKADSANRSSFTIGGKDAANTLHFIDQRVARLDSLGIVDELFSIQTRWKPEVFFVEGGVIWKSIEPMLYQEMRQRDIWLNVQVINPVKDKAVRGRSLQKRMRAGGCRFNKEASWYEEFENELLRFTGTSEALLDDQFDSAALLSKGFEEFRLLESDEFITDAEEEFETRSRALRKGSGSDGRSQVTGY